MFGKNAQLDIFSLSLSLSHSLSFSLSLSFPFLTCQASKQLCKVEKPIHQENLRNENGDVAAAAAAAAPAIEALAKSTSYSHIEGHFSRLFSFALFSLWIAAQFLCWLSDASFQS